jgi:O-antigen/teichoic acid export membrane protein
MKSRFNTFKLQTHMLVAIAAWASKIITAGVQVIIMRYLIKYLGVDEYGAFAVLASLAGWLALTDCGFGTAFQNTLSLHRAQNITHEHLLIQARFVQYGLFIIWIPLLILISFPVSSYLFSHMYLSTSKIVIVVIIGNVIWMSNAVASIAYKILYALQLGVYANIYPAIGSIFSLFAIVQLTKYDIEGGKLLWSVLAYSTPMALASMAANAHIKTSENVFLKKIYWSDLKIVAVNAWRFFGFSLLVAGVTGLDYLIMAQILSPNKIAAYTVISKVFIFIYFLYYSILTAIWPVITELMTLKCYKDVKKHLIKALIFGVLIICIGTITFIYFRIDISNILTGGKVPVSAQSIIFFGVYYLLRVWGDAFAVVIASINKVNIFYIYMPFQAAISAGAQYLLGRKYGIDGIILGIAISFFITAVWINPISLRGIIKQNKPC